MIFTNINNELNMLPDHNFHKYIVEFLNNLNFISFEDNFILFNKLIYIKLVNANLSPLSDTEKNNLLNIILKEIRTKQKIDITLKPKYNKNVKNQYYQLYYSDEYGMYKNITNLLYYCDIHDNNNETITLNYDDENNNQISRRSNKNLVSDKLYYNINYENYKLDMINDNLQHIDYIIGEKYSDEELKQKYQRLLKKYAHNNSKEELITNISNTFINNLTNTIERLKFNHSPDIYLSDLLDYCVINFNYDKYIDDKYFNGAIIKFINTYISCIYPTEYRITDDIISKYFMSLIYSCIMNDEYNSYSRAGSICNLYGMYKYTQNNLDVFYNNIKSKIGQIDDNTYNYDLDKIRQNAEKMVI